MPPYGAWPGGTASFLACERSLPNGSADRSAYTNENPSGRPPGMSARLGCADELTTESIDIAIWVDLKSNLTTAWAHEYSQGDAASGKVPDQAFHGRQIWRGSN